MMISNLVKFPLVFISGIFIPLEQMPPWGQMLAWFSPLTYIVDIVRYSFTNSNFLPIIIDFVVLILFTIAGTGLSMYLHKRLMPSRL